MSIARLAEPFHVSQIHWRVGSTNGEKTSGMALAYLNARDVEDRLDLFVGRENWQSRYPWSDGKKLTCEIGIRCGKIIYDANDPAGMTNAGWIWKSNGAGDTDYEADKGAYSDAFKRAAVPWGIGRYLYSSPNWWAQIVKKGKSYVFTDAAIKELNQKYEAWLLPGRQAKFNEAFAKHHVLVDSMLEALEVDEVDAAAEYWVQIPEEDQASLWLAKSSGGLFDQKVKTLIRSTNFAMKMARAQK